jgi:hypothetical protein
MRQRWGRRVFEARRGKQDAGEAFDHLPVVLLVSNKGRYGGSAPERKSKCGVGNHMPACRGCVVRVWGLGLV